MMDPRRCFGGKDVVVVGELSPSGKFIYCLCSALSNVFTLSIPQILELKMSDIQQYLLTQMLPVLVSFMLSLLNMLLM